MTRFKDGDLVWARTIDEAESFVDDDQSVELDEDTLPVNGLLPFYVIDDRVEVEVDLGAAIVLVGLTTIAVAIFFDVVRRLVR